MGYHYEPLGPCSKAWPEIQHQDCSTSKTWGRQNLGMKQHQFIRSRIVHLGIPHGVSVLLLLLRAVKKQNAVARKFGRALQDSLFVVFYHPISVANSFEVWVSNLDSHTKSHVLLTKSTLSSLKWWSFQSFGNQTRKPHQTSSKSSNHTFLAEITLKLSHLCC